LNLLRRAVFLDRDGVLNEAIFRNGKPHPPSDLSQMVIFPGVPAALARLKAADLILIVVTNQPDVARGTALLADVVALNDHLCAKLPLDLVVMCTHDDADDCLCRKPRPGMLLAAADRLGISLPASVMVGDRWRDIEAGRRAGCRTILVGDGYDETFQSEPDLRARDLSSATDLILAE